MAKRYLTDGAKIVFAFIIGGSAGATWYFYANGNIAATAAAVACTVFSIAFTRLF